MPAEDVELILADSFTDLLANLNRVTGIAETTRMAGKVVQAGTPFVR